MAEKCPPTTTTKKTHKKEGWATAACDGCGAPTPETDTTEERSWPVWRRAGWGIFEGEESRAMRPSATCPACMAKPAKASHG